MISLLLYIKWSPYVRLASQIVTLDTTHQKAESSQYNGEIRGCSLITITTIYTEGTIHILRHKETRNS